jgi:hypothetical protein
MELCIMRFETEELLRSRTVSIPLEVVGGETGFRGAGPGEFRDVIEAASIVAHEAGLSLQRWVTAGRRQGMSWSDIGEVLGISKQAAQQRFRTELEVGDVVESDQIEVKLGATAFNEERLLEQAGRAGNELIGVGVLSLIFRKTSKLWEYRRVVAIVPHKTQLKFAKAGWTYAASWFPFHYFKRPVVK